MLYSLVFFLVANTVSVYGVQSFLDGFHVGGGWIGCAVVGLIIGLLNIFVKPFIKLFSLPFIFLTAGLFMIVVNAIILWIAQVVTNGLGVEGISLTIDGITTYIAAVLLFGVLNYLFQKVFQ